MLEARDVPSAAYYWSPTSTSGDLHASVAANWTDGTGNRSFATGPGANDDLYFTGVTIPSGNSVPTYPTAICLVSAGSTFTGIHLVYPSGGSGGYGYGAVGVQLEGSASVGTLELRQGVIIQNADGTASAEASTLTVTQHFTWTGGILNSSANAGTVKIVGVTDAELGQKSQVDGSMLSAGSLTTGSTVSLLSGTILASWGAIVLNNDANFIVGQSCSHIDPLFPPNNPDPKAWGTSIEKGNGGTSVQGSIIVIEGYDKALGNKNKVPVFIDGGTLDVASRDFATTGYFATKPDGTPWNAGNDKVSVYLKSGELNIVNSLMLKATDSVRMDAGKLTTQTLNLPAGQRVSTIDAPLWIVGGEVIIGADDLTNTHRYSTLHVTKDVTFQAGTYKPFVDATSDTLRDRWTTNSFFNFWGAAVIAPVVLNGNYVNQQNPGNENGKGKSYEVVVAVGGFFDDTRPVVSVAADWQIVDGRDPIGQGNPGYNPTYRSLLVKKLSTN